MLSENLMKLRKEKGFSQEQLAVRLNVVRQTISKWEKGISVPDAEMITEIAEVFNVSVSDLLGKDVDTDQKDNSLDVIASELAKLNELLVVQHQKNELIKKRIVEAFIIVLFLFSWVQFMENGMICGMSLARIYIICFTDIRM